ncbi:phasin family protein [Oryzibacter oryziterrae]|uniref:phasin family protein n=1 Tax=Oryzibacter oryziterrae TaxID=2766474 RepID=UPI001F276AD6|nr:phasin family protein [Oryzibacter oryziterrae]
MATGFDDVQKVFKDNLDTAIKSADVIAKSFQALATEATDYSKKSVEDSSKYFEKLLGAKSVDVAIGVQSDFFKKSYEDAMAQFTRVGEIYTDLAKEISKPYETFAVKFGK